MCFCDDGESPSVYRETWHTAKKPHRCCECRDEIRVSEKYHRVFGVWDGEAQEFKTCESCVEVREQVYEMTDYWPTFGSAGCCYAEALRECA